MESVYWCWSVAGAVLHVVDGHGDHVAGLGQRGTQPDVFQGYAGAGIGCLLQRVSEVVEVFDDAVNQVLGGGVIQAGHGFGHVYHGSVLDNSQFEIVEECQLHFLLLLLLDYRDGCGGAGLSTPFVR